MIFNYKARDVTGNLIRGKGEAPTAEMVSEMLKQKRLTPLEISESNMRVWEEMVERFGKVSFGEMATFTRQLATMISAGLPITDALNLLKIQSSPALSKVVGHVMGDVQGGVSLSEALTKHPNVFSRVYVALVRAGETAGVMEKVLTRLADSLEKTREFRGKVAGAMIYPAIVLMGMVGVMIIMVVVVIPKLTALYQDFGATLPLPTRILMGISNIFLNYWWAVIVVVGGAIFALGSYLKTPAGKRMRDVFIFKIPIWGTLTKQIMLTELTRTLSLLISAGVSIVEALDIVAGVVGNITVEKDVKRVSRQVEKGFPVSIAFSESPFFPPIVGQMIAVGEETGKMDEVLDKLSHYFESESELRVKGLTTAIEPLIIMVLAVGVGFLMYAVIMPIYDITNKI
ncbi:MAG: Uncharacterized protein G01um101416_680 [Microgenomates group bacterium Gr01-1014_16]|nr:MAG: Uncharacterized protein G01um101416_680 [Microgenomates group bacterium Gr01-1014_16]